jgi:membrane-bound lytic murein transglycosylase D
VTPAPDPVSSLIASSQDHFAAGERELKLGHLDRARLEFDRAVDVLLESPYGARSDARLREHFDRLIDRINAHEVTALAQGDGFSERRTEPASIDEILSIATFPRPDAAASTEATVAADLAATEHDVPIPQNEQVLAAVELLSGRLRDYVQESLIRGAKYLPMIQNVFRAEGLPLDLAYIPVIESGFKTNALSKASAKGPWQFMKPTAKDHGLKTDWYVDERSDPEKATVAAAKYLKMLHKLFDGDWHLVLAAYNGGQGRVQRAMKAARVDDFWSLAQSSR